MSQQYRTVLWNRQKKHYDRWLTAGIVVCIGLFCLLTLAQFPEITVETLIIRAFGTTAFVLLTLILCIGPLARLEPRALPLLYNRRHLGVATFLVASVHGLFSLIQFHALGDVSPLVSLLTHYPVDATDDHVPFQIFGFVTLLILFAMAATSHDFWLANLSAPVWKALHMLVYVAYVSLLTHVAFGAMQAQQSTPLLWILAASATLVVSLQLIAGWRELGRDREAASTEWIRLCRPTDIPNNRAHVATISGDRVAVFRYDKTISAISAVCQHQNGPLGEGCIIDGLVTCPWHGYQYNPRTGTSPAPFSERVPTFDVRLNEGYVEVHQTPNPPDREATFIALSEQTPLSQ